LFAFAFLVKELFQCEVLTNYGTNPFLLKVFNRIQSFSDVGDLFLQTGSPLSQTGLHVPILAILPERLDVIQRSRYTEKANAYAIAS